MKSSIHRTRLMKRFDQMTEGTAFAGKIDLAKGILEEIASPSAADVAMIQIARTYLDADKTSRRRMHGRQVPGMPKVAGTPEEVEAFFVVVAKLAIVDDVIGIEDRIARMQAFADAQLASLSA